MPDVSMEDALLATTHFHQFDLGLSRRNLRLP